MHSRKSSPRVQRTKIHKLEVHCKGSWVHSIYRFALHISQFWMLWCFFTFNLLFWVDPQSKSQNSGKLMKMIGHTCVAYNRPWQSKLQGPSRWHQSYHNTSWYRLSSFTMKRLVSSFNTNPQNKALIIIHYDTLIFFKQFLTATRTWSPRHGSSLTLEPYLMEVCHTNGGGWTWVVQTKISVSIIII